LERHRDRASDAADWRAARESGGLQRWGNVAAELFKRRGGMVAARDDRGRRPLGQCEWSMKRSSVPSPQPARLLVDADYRPFLGG
jgi:hypothetical protein